MVVAILLLSALVMPGPRSVDRLLAVFAAAMAVNLRGAAALSTAAAVSRF
jgi:hypothetical protein